MLGARLALVTLALIVCAWFALGVRSVHDQQSVFYLVHHVSGVLTPRQESDALRQLDSAAVLNPDGELDVLRAHVLLDAGDPTLAKRVLKGLVARQPKNIEAWNLLHFTPPPYNPDSRVAAVRIRELAPGVPASR